MERGRERVSNEERWIYRIRKEKRGREMEKIEEKDQKMEKDLKI